VAGLGVGALFSALGWVPVDRNVTAFSMAVSWDPTTYLNIVMLAVIALLALRFLRTGGIGMLRMMQAPADHMAHHGAGTSHEPVAGA
jgi:hypothetical protein